MKTGVYSFEDGKEPKDLEKQIKVFKKQLEIAKKCLKEYAVFKCKDSWFAETALEQIKELDK